MCFFNTDMKQEMSKRLRWVAKSICPGNQSSPLISIKSPIETLKVQVSKSEWRACTFNDMLGYMYESTSLSQRAMKELHPPTTNLSSF